MESATSVLLRFEPSDTIVTIKGFVHAYGDLNESPVNFVFVQVYSFVPKCKYATYVLDSETAKEEYSFTEHVKSVEDLALYLYDSDLNTLIKYLNTLNSDSKYAFHCMTY